MTDPGFDAVEKQIRDAQARGEFDDLPGAGKPLRLSSSHDPDWWVRGLIERERLDMTGALPSAIQLRKEAETFPESLLDVTREETVREILEDYNRRARLDRLKVVHGEAPPIVAPLVDVEPMVERWREGRRTHRVRVEPVEPPASPKRRRWWRRTR